MKDIFNDLTEAENSVKSYTLMKNAEDMSRFYSITEVTGSKFDELKQLCVPGDTMASLIDTLDGLVEEKFEILDMLLLMQDESNVEQAMKGVMQSLKEKEPPAGTAAVDTSDQLVKKKEGNFFTRLFSRKDRKRKKETDTATATPVPERELLLDEISSLVKKARKEEMTRSQTLRQEEWDLLQQDKLVMDKIRMVIATMEQVEAAYLAISTKNAERKAGEVKHIIIAFVVSASLLLLMATLVIYRYVRWNNDYRRALKLARNEAEELARAKEQFLATMSHEVRSPMNIISGFIGQLLKSRLDADQRDQLDMVKKSSDHLLQMINDLLDLSRLKAGKLELQETEFSPGEVMNDMQNMLAPIAMEKKIDLLAWTDPALPAVVCGDAVRLRQILFNLAGNAIKFTDKGQVSLRAYPGQSTNEDTLFIFEVKDTGIGINESDLNKIFEEFEQGAGIAGQHRGGTGLGLAITRKLVELQGGRLWVESRVGEGSSFRAEIPYHISKGKLKNENLCETAVDRSLENIRILVVDDEEYNRRLMKAVLGKYGCVVTEAKSGEEALHGISGHPVEVILMDLRLPGMSGAEAAREIRKISADGGTKIPIIAVSAAVTPASMEEFRKNGIDDFILKPFDEEHLVQTILAVLAKDAKQKKIEKKVFTTATAPAPENNIKSRPAYDLKPLMEASAGDKVFFGEMIRLFIENTTQGLNEVSTCIAVNEWEKAADIIHSLSPPCHHLKAERLYTLLKDAEQSLRTTGKYHLAAETIRQARKEFDLIAKDLETHCEL
ncbi:MAG: response regulator [Bacteroidetes bacterium]|nr:response regulator [Bacteroidota bacterium]